MLRLVSFATALAVLAYISVGCASAPEHLPRVETPDCVDRAVNEFIKATETVPQERGSITLHSIMLVQHGKVIAERWMNGAGPDIPHELYSVSKTFTSSAIGLAIAEGKLSLSDKVVSFFPDDLPGSVSENLAAMTVRDLLTMSCGHSCEPGEGYSYDSDWVKMFLAHPVEHVPGTHFLYNSVGTYMLSAILQKVTGEKLLDYLDARLFQPLRISKPVWDESHQGITCGGWGLKLTTEDMAKMGQLLLQGGRWYGRQILPADWVKEMSSFQAASAPSGAPIEKLTELGLTKEKSDWVQGYGYQMWLCRHGAFRADGLKGQYIIILPEKDAVIVLTTDTNLYQPYIDIVWDKLLPALQG